MTDFAPHAGSDSAPRLVRGRGRIWARVVLFTCLVVALIYVGIAAQQLKREKDVLRLTQEQTVASTGLTSAGRKALSTRFADSGGRLLADPPTSTDQTVNPDTLVVAHIGGTEATPSPSWSDWETRLARITGKKVLDEIYTNSPDQIAAISSGKIAILALHAADMPFVVNNYGFQPVAALGDQSGINGHRLDLIVPTDSPITKPEDIKGHRLVCTVPSSITGYRAAIAMLVHQHGLRPNVDYEIIWSTGQKRSIGGIGEKKYEVAAVSDNKLTSMVADGTAQTSQYNVIYQSQVLPRTTIGYFYNLDPALAEQVRKAILEPGPTTAPAGLHFVPIDYKRDFQFVREIDDQFDPRFDAKTKKNSQTE